MWAYPLHIILLGLCLYFCWKRTKNQSLSVFFLPFALLKLLAGLAVGVVFIYGYGGGDLATFSKYASRLADVAQQTPSAYWDILQGGYQEMFPYVRDDARTTPRLLFAYKLWSIFFVLTGKSHWLVGLYCSLFSFLCSWLCVQSLYKCFPNNKWGLLFAFFVFPSVVFWSSGMLKESLAIGIVHFLLAVVLRLLYEKKYNWWQFALTPCFLWLLWKLKYYYFGASVSCLLAFVFAFFLQKKLQTKWQGQTLAYLLIFSILGVMGMYVHPSLYPENIAYAITINNHTMASQSQANTIIHYLNIQDNALSFVINAPLAVVAGLFRPFIWEANNAFKLVTGLENLLVLFLFFYQGIQLLSQKIKQNQKHFLLILMACVYVGMLVVVLPLAAPNLGALARYKAAYLPFLIYLLSFK